MGRTALKITLAVAMAAGLLLGVSGCGKSAEAEKQAPASKAGTEKVLRVGGEATYPPFLFKDEHGHYVGFEMDLIKAVAKEIGADYILAKEIQTSNYSTILEKIDNGCRFGQFVDVVTTLREEIRQCVGVPFRFCLKLA